MINGLVFRINDFRERDIIGAKFSITNNGLWVPVDFSYKKSYRPVTDTPHFSIIEN